MGDFTGGGGDALCWKLESAQTTSLFTRFRTGERCCLQKQLEISIQSTSDNRLLLAMRPNSQPESEPRCCAVPSLFLNHFQSAGSTLSSEIQFSSVRFASFFY